MRNNQKGLGAVVIIVAVLVLAVIGGAAYFLLKKNGNSSSNSLVSVASNATTKKAFDDCKKEYSDDDLCKALSNFMGNKQYQTTMTMSGSGGMVINMEVDGDKTYTKQTISGKSLETIYIGNTHYTKDNTDGKWWKQVFTTTPTSTTDDFKFDTNISESTKTKTTYTKIGQEACDKLTCIKYKVAESDSKDIQYIWIDTKDHLMRKWSTESSDGTKTEATYSYNKKSVDAPGNTKDASATQNVIPADFYSGMMNSTDTTNSTTTQSNNSQSADPDTTSPDESSTEE